MYNPPLQVSSEGTAEQTEKRSINLIGLPHLEFFRLPEYFTLPIQLGDLVIIKEPQFKRSLDKMPIILSNY